MKGVRGTDVGHITVEAFEEGERDLRKSLLIECEHAELR